MNFLKGLLLYLFVFFNQGAGTSCKKPVDDPGAEVETGYVAGLVQDGKGQPMAGVRIIIDNSIFFNANISTVTNQQGRYKVKVPTGSWFAFAQVATVYEGKTYTQYLHPDNNSGFGGEGAVRNFEWKLSGDKHPPLSGTYGGLITFDNFPGTYLEEEKKIEFKLEPVGPLIDGSAGTTLTLRSADGYKLENIPMGKYRLSASYEGNTLYLRRWNTDNPFGRSFEFVFEPEIAAQCNNCFMLEYSTQN
ncbi:MAG: carboxypeptidase-like regulatory domain-containing protein [Candidatus Pseudobacter hemicellulosilyticus]|uniref:Carboxypeptidase-like regulatory domain-containing protein n=1 Tax=Candidatus Pseudobacter hemicellulosilyticus TaxID=3121375 RepID=A0AAJ5X0L2_9BACT|nr:MAG: carboxypeptidase-like regulatory domain-containing protein [Pseudobacter sp.]